MGTIEVVIEDHTALREGTLHERFYRAVHEEPVLHYDVVLSGFAEKYLRARGAWNTEKTFYDMVLLHRGLVDDAMMDRMLALQDKVALHREPHPDNKIDYKFSSEVEAHFNSGGLGLGLITREGELIGQVLLSFRQPGTGPFAEDGEPSQANIDWLMVDGDYSGNFLCKHLIGMAIQMAESSGMSQIRAHVRTHNERAVSKFSDAGFVAAGMGDNQKDGSAHLRLFRPFGGVTKTVEVASRVATLAGLHEGYKRDHFERETGHYGLIGKWDRTAKWFTFHAFTEEPKANVEIFQPHP